MVEQPAASRSTTIRHVCVVACCLTLACSPTTNLWFYTTPAAHRASVDVQVALARAYFDAGELEPAFEHAKLAYRASPESEEAATILGYVYLSLAGVSPFILAEKMMTNKGAEKSGSDEAANAASAGGTSNALGGLDGVVGLDDAEFALLGTVNTAVPALPVIEPVCAGVARRDVQKLEYVNTAIAVVCPFVDPEVLIATDLRHNCSSITTQRARRPQSHFLWAFAHLVEAVAFHKIVNYTTTDSPKSNLELRADAVQELGASISDDISRMDEFIQAMDDFANTTDRVLQTAGECSPEHPQTQLTALVNDLVSVSNGFGRMEGVPKQMTASIDEAIAGINSVQARSTDVSTDQGQAGAIKGDLTQEMAKSLGEAITNIDPESYSPEQIDEVCNSYSQISGNIADDVNRPELCPAP